MSTANAPQAVRDFVERICKAQGCKPKVTKERSGYQLYIPCPDCLHTHGKREIADPKYCINISKHLGIGQEESETPWLEDWVEEESTRNNRVGICMRTRMMKKPHLYPIPRLLEMGTVTERHPDIHTSMGDGDYKIDVVEREARWEPDPVTGVLCPPPPSASPQDLIPITQLGADHVASHYLTSRKFDLQRLEDMMSVSYCTKEYPHGQNNIWYRRM